MDQPNLVYGCKCAEPGCSESYIAEIKQSLKFGQHRHPSSSDCQSDSVVYAHARSTGHQIDPGEVIILEREERWFGRGVREVIWERIEQQSLNKRGGSGFNFLTLGTNH